MAANASELFREMLSAILTHNHKRQSTDSCSAMQEVTVEASPGCTFSLWHPEYNVPDFRAIDMTWATGNVLHFFSNTEKAWPLPKINPHAHKFVQDDVWRGAYGPIAMPQIWSCLHLLAHSPDSRKAVVSMGELKTIDINSPPCWSLLHFLNAREGLDLCVYQRSLNLLGVFPYDCILLTNILIWAAKKLGVKVGRLHWTIGSLHMVPKQQAYTTGERHRSLIVNLDTPWESLCELATRAQAVAGP